MKENKLNNKRSLLFYAAALLMCIALCGCLSSPLAKRSASFGNAASLVIRDSSTAYDAVERTTYNANVSSLVLDFDDSGFDRNKIKPFLSPNDLEARQVVLRGLQSYSEDLAQVAGDQAFAPLDAQAKALSQQIVTLTSNGELKKFAPNVSEDEAKGLATAADTLAKVLIERKRKRELPKIIAKMQPVLERLCNLLDQDLGAKPTNGKGGHGLRDQLWNEYDTLIDNQTDYIQNNKDRLSPAEKTAEIAKLPKLVAQQQSADASLASTQQALRDLVETHRALLLPQQDATFRTRLNVLIQDGQQIGQFYGSLASK
jgi:hypothetical protein